MCCKSGVCAATIAKFIQIGYNRLKEGDGMISFFSNVITDFFIRKKVINQDSKDLHKYGFEMLISTMLDILIVLIVGILSGAIINSLIFFTVFALLRRFTGGYHASTYAKCKITFCIICFVVINLSKIELNVLPACYDIISLSIFLFTIIAYTPIINSNKPVAKENLESNKNRSLIIGTVISLIGIITSLIDRSISITISLTLISICILIYIEYFGERGEYNGKQSVRNDC